MLDLARIGPLLDQALAEDVGDGDRTTLWTVPPEARGRGRILARARGVICGLPVAAEVFRRVEPRLAFRPRVEEGAEVAPGQTVAEVEGPLSGILTGERVALNFLQRLSGIATLTRRFVEAVSGTKAVILDTRKTTPGWRLLEKYAVRVGGGQNHRMGLYDMVLIKENHIAAAGSLRAAVERVRARNREGLPVEVEVRTLEELEEALALGVRRILLDNMDLETLQEAVERTGGRARLEASGGVTLETVRAVAETGVDFISVGALTHSAPALDLSLLIEAEGKETTGR